MRAVYARRRTKSKLEEPFFAGLKMADGRRLGSCGGRNAPDAAARPGGS